MACQQRIAGDTVRAIPVLVGTLGALMALTGLWIARRWFESSRPFWVSGTFYATCWLLFVNPCR